MSALATSGAGALAARRASTPVWAVAAVVALALHGGLILAALWSARADDADDDVGAQAIELAMDMAAPKAEPTDMPPGPESDASAAAPESARATPKAETPDLPKDEPVEAQDPDRLVTTEVARKPEQKPDETNPQPSEASSASIAAEATAAPTQQAVREARVAAAPAIGVGQNASVVRAAWQKRLFTHLGRSKRYPANVRQRQAENKVVFTLDRTGHVVAARISSSSGDAAFDGAALDMMKRADPVPAPPPLVADETLTFEIPVVFKAPGR